MSVVQVCVWLEHKDMYAFDSVSQLGLDKRTAVESIYWYNIHH